MNVAYFIMLAAVYSGLRRLRTGAPSGELPVSIVIAARNEEDSIIGCLESLTRLDYPEDKYEVVLVDDHSQDSTPEKIIAFCEKRVNWKYILLKEKSGELRGKKNALLHGINHARHELIFTTDADCRVPEGWLRRMAGYFRPDVSMVLGYSPLAPGKGFLYRLLQFDNLFSAIASAAPVKLGYPFTSVGRNLAYRKKIYEDAGGFLALKKFKSVDDVHLTERFRYLNTGKIDFCADPSTFVETRLLHRVGSVFQQQIRKNSKTLIMSAGSVLISLLIFSYYMMMISYPFLLPGSVLIWGILAGVKLIIEYIDLRKAALIFRQNDLIGWIPLMQIVYPFHIIFFSIIGVFQVYRWKK
jgi:cellulose synthase/poly-beta-1,6-N-acetylglucosamine synthase-like glycosyltransferase